MKVVYLALCATLLLNSFQAAAGVVVGGTRLVYPGGKKEATITVKNPDDIPYLVQSWVNADLEGNVKAPFLVTPPLFRLNGGKENTLRVVKTAQALPEDRESVFWLSVKTVPPEAEGKGNHLQIACAPASNCSIARRRWSVCLKRRLKRCAGSAAATR